jgi:hypothetical protein
VLFVGKKKTHSSLVGDMLLDSRSTHPKCNAGAKQEVALEHVEVAACGAINTWSASGRWGAVIKLEAARGGGRGRRT